MRRRVGVVAALNRYPVKSMAGETLAEADLRWSGLRGAPELTVCSVSGAWVAQAASSEQVAAIRVFFIGTGGVEKLANLAQQKTGGYIDSPVS